MTFHHRLGQTVLLLLGVLCAELPVGADSNFAPTDAPAPLKLGKPGEVFHQTAIALKQPKKSADRAEGGPNHVLFTLWIPEGLKTIR